MRVYKIPCCFQGVLLLCIFFVSLTRYPAHATERPETVPDTAAIKEYLGETIDLELKFTDENGEEKTLRDIVPTERPAIIIPVYFNCPRMCPLLLGHVRKVVNELDLEIGKDYDLLSVSFDSSDTPTLAKSKKEEYLPKKSGWHFLTGEQDHIDSLMKQVGFGFSKDGNDFIHTAVMVVLSPQGKITRYFYGFKPEVKQLRLALVDASEGKIGETLERIFLYCFRYDHTSGQYTLAIMNVIRVISLGILLVLVITLVTFYYQERA